MSPNFDQGTVSILHLEEAFNLTFTASGLPTGTNWTAVVGGTPRSSMTATITFTEPNGSYAWSISPVPGFATVWNGNITVNGTDVQIAATFARFTYLLSFAELGLPSGMTWTVTVRGIPRSSATSTITFPEPNGTYAWSITPIADYSTEWNGGTTINGTSASLVAMFTQVAYSVTFTEAGLPTAENWTVTLAGTSRSSTETALNFSEPNGSYNWSISPIAGYTTIWSGNVTINGTNGRVFAIFTQVTYRVTFTEFGLPSGTRWTVTFNGLSRSGTGELEFSGIPNGSAEFVVSAVEGFSNSPESGTVQVHGDPATEPITFTPAPGSMNTFLGLPAAEGYALLGGFAAAIGVGLAIAGWRRRWRRIGRRPEQLTQAVDEGAPPKPP